MAIDFFGFKKKKISLIRQSYWGTSPKVPIWMQRNDDERLGKIHGGAFATDAWHIDHNPKLKKILKGVSTKLRVLAAKNLRNEASGAKFAAATDYERNEILYNQDMKPTLKEKQRAIAHEVGHFKLREKGIKPHTVPLSKKAMEELKKTNMYKNIQKDGYPIRNIPEEAFAIYYQNLKGPDMTAERQEKFKKKYPCPAKRVF